MATINKKILLVEDDEDFLFILQKKFTTEGFSVVTAKDGQEGVVVAQQEKPDLILSDILIPKMDGIDMAKKIWETDAGMPIMFLTNLKDVEDARDPEKKFDYIIKSDTRIDDIVAKAKAKLGIE